jgi:TetR/AcrR family transcriptional regulator, cholesterol catabolism regulator
MPVARPENPMPSPKVSRKDQIETAATALFKERGFAATSMRDLANEVGIEAASIYSHVRSKEELLQSICFKMAQDFFEVLENQQTRELSFAHRLREIITAHVVIITRNVAASVVFQQEWRHLSEPYLSSFLELREQYEQRIRDIIRHGAEIGEFIATDAKFATRTLLSSLNWIPQWYRLDGELSPVEIAQNIADLFLKGLCNHPAERPKYH